jgi:uncharacterized protein YodC (DUF2158 family)
MNTFNVGDKVVLNGTTEPVMIIKGHPTYASGTVKTDVNLFVCFWADKDGPHWEKFSPAQLKLFSNS